MRYVLLVILVALAVVLALHLARERKAGPAEEAGARLDEAKQAALGAQLREVEAALDAYAGERGGYPADLAELVPGHLRAADLLVDPWGTPLRLERDGAAAAVASAGPDRIPGSGDDVRRSL
ncbi:MAG TPA: type II secretion system protein GspG [Candidatus Aminicenantes bacterium]|nr:type II secretion system protein GspG [Candidatus Aminicenantes bacterium]